MSSKKENRSLKYLLWFVGLDVLFSLVFTFFLKDSFYCTSLNLEPIVEKKKNVIAKEIERNFNVIFNHYNKNKIFVLDSSKLHYESTTDTSIHGVGYYARKMKNPVFSVEKIDVDDIYVTSYTSIKWDEYYDLDSLSSYNNIIYLKIIIDHYHKFDQELDPVEKIPIMTFPPTEKSFKTSIYLADIKWLGLSKLPPYEYNVKVNGQVDDIFYFLFPFHYENIKNEIFVPLSIDNVDKNVEDVLTNIRGRSTTFWDTFWRMLYFSTTTITTLGYGDIIPLTTCARTLTALEVVLGLIIMGRFLIALANKIAVQSRNK